MKFDWNGTPISFSHIVRVNYLKSVYQLVSVIEILLKEPHHHHTYPFGKHEDDTDQLRLY